MTTLSSQTLLGILTRYCICSNYKCSPWKKKKNMFRHIMCNWNTTILSRITMVWGFACSLIAFFFFFFVMHKHVCTSLHSCVLLLCCIFGTFQTRFFGPHVYQFSQSNLTPSDLFAELFFQPDVFNSVFPLCTQKCTHYVEQFLCSFDICLVSIVVA